VADVVDIVPVRDARDLRLFLDFPYRLYRGDPYWVPPLRIAQKELFDTKRHPFHRHATVQCFLARENGQILGRIAAVLDPNYSQFHEEQTAFFGFFECVNRQDAASALLDTARGWLRERGAQVIRGPVNPSTNYECGLLVEGFDSSPQVMMPYNPRYYPELLEGAGLKKARDLYAYQVTYQTLTPEKLERVAERAVNGNRVSIRHIRMNEFQQEVERVWEVYNSAWSRNWGFVPMTREEFLFMARDMKTILQPELVLLGEVKGKLVGFALALPDINQALKPARGRLFPLGLLRILYHKRSIKDMRVLILGVLEEYRSAGVPAGFYAELVRRGRRLGYEAAEMSWVLEDNILMRRSIEALGGRQYKTYRIYEWK
jgi:GNAT superfamily N-acetyltransferase